MPPTRRSHGVKIDASTLAHRPQSVWGTPCEAPSPSPHRPTSWYQPRIWHLSLLVLFVAIAIADIQDQRVHEPFLITLAIGGFVLYALIGWLGWWIARRRLGSRLGPLWLFVIYAIAMGACSWSRPSSTSSSSISIASGDSDAGRPENADQSRRDRDFFRTPWPEGRSYSRRSIDRGQEGGQPTGEVAPKLDAERQIFLELVNRHGATVLAMLRRLCGNPHDADDVFQEVAARVWRNLGSRPRCGARGPGC